MHTSTHTRTHTRAHTRNTRGTTHMHAGRDFASHQHQHHSRGTSRRTEPARPRAYKHAGRGVRVAGHTREQRVGRGRAHALASLFSPLSLPPSLSLLFLSPCSLPSDTSRRSSNPAEHIAPARSHSRYAQHSEEPPRAHPRARTRAASRDAERGQSLTSASTAHPSRNEHARSALDPLFSPVSLCRALTQSDLLACSLSLSML